MLRVPKARPHTSLAQNLLVSAFEADEVHDLQASKAELLGNDFLEVVLDAELLRVLFGHEEFLVFENDFLEHLCDCGLYEECRMALAA